MSKREDNLIRQIEGRCHHYTGTQHETCKAGVNYLQLAGGKIDGMALRLPCCAPQVFAKRREELGYELAVCPSLQRITREEAEAETKEIIGRGDRTMKAATAAHKDAEAKGFRKGQGGADSIPCPLECGGRLYYRVAGYNGHMHAKCDTEGCVSWME